MRATFKILAALLFIAVSSANAAIHLPYFVYDDGSGNLSAQDSTGSNNILGTLNSGGSHQFAVSLSPTGVSSAIGSLGGALAGTLPNPTLATGAVAASLGAVTGDLAGSSLPNTVIANLAVTNGKMAAGGAAANLGSPGGALAGTWPSPTLAAGAARQVVVPNCNAASLAAATTYYCGSTESSTQTLASGLVARAGTFKNLYTQQSAAPGGATTTIYTLYVNGSSTSVTCTTTGAATTCSDLTHTAAITAGQSFSVQAVNLAAAAATVPVLGIELDN